MGKLAVSFGEGISLSKTGQSWLLPPKPSIQLLREKPHALHGTGPPNPTSHFRLGQEAFQQGHLLGFAVVALKHAFVFVGFRFTVVTFPFQQKTYP